MIHVRSGVAVCLSLCLAVANAAGASPPFHFSVRPIEPAAGLQSLVPTGFNNLGHVIGHATRGDGSRAVFLYDGTQVQELAALTAIGATVADINNVGQIVGQAGNRAFRYEAGTVTYFADSAYQGSAASSINDAGVATGWARRIGASQGKTVRFENLSVIDAGTFDDEEEGPFGFGGTYGVAINESGDIAGVGGHVAGYLYAFILHPDGSFNLPTLGNYDGHTTATGLNNAGDVVGTAPDGDGLRHAFRYRDPVGVDLTPGYPGESAALAINNPGWIAGGRTLWDSDGTAYAIADLVAPDSPWSVDWTGNLLNDNGQLVTTACLKASGACQLVLLTPVPEPFAASMLSGGMLALAVLGGRRRRSKGGA